MVDVRSTLAMCRTRQSPYQETIEDRLIKEALRLGGHRTKKATVTEALQEYIQRRRQIRVLSVFWKIEFDAQYDYKRTRRTP